MKHRIFTTFILLALLLAFPRLASADLNESFDFVGTGNTPPVERNKLYDHLDWDFSVHTRDLVHELDRMSNAMHGSDCSAPPASHVVTDFEQAVYGCKNHIMTAINSQNEVDPESDAGYALISFTPNHMVDFSSGEASISFAMSTSDTSGRDWVDITISPWQDQKILPLTEFLPDLTGMPRNAILIEKDAEGSFRLYIYKNGVRIEPEPNYPQGYISHADVISQTEDVRLGKTRSKFEVKLKKLASGKTNVSFCLPDNSYSEGRDTYDPFCFIDREVDINFDKGVVQFGHHSYTPFKDCPSSVTDGVECAANTWHWDNFQISPSIPFTIIHTSPYKRLVSSRNNGNTNAQTVTFEKSAPDNAYLRFFVVGVPYVSLDGGNSFTKATTQPVTKDGAGPEDGLNVFHPIPKGTRNVVLRIDPPPVSWWGSLEAYAQDFSIWSRTGTSSGGSGGGGAGGGSGGSAWDIDGDGDVDWADLMSLLGKASISIFDYNGFVSSLQ